MAVRYGHGVHDGEFLNWSDEAVAAPGERFDEARVLRRVAQCITDAIDGTVESAIEIHHRVIRPDPLLQLLPGQHLTGPFQEGEKEFERLLLKLDFAALFEELPGAGVDLEGGKAEWVRSAPGDAHSRNPLYAL